MPDAVAERLEWLARRAGVPLSTFALQELTEATRRADNASVLAALPSHDLPPDRILKALDASRDAR